MCWKADKVSLKRHVKTNLGRTLPVFLNFSVGKYQRLLGGRPACHVWLRETVGSRVEDAGRVVRPALETKEQIFAVFGRGIIRACIAGSVGL